MDEKELDKYINKYLNGDKESFDIIYQETSKGVYLSIRTIISNRSVIEDIMQDTYIKAIDKLDTYKLGTNFQAWICRIARNNAINHYNKYKREEILDPGNPVFVIEDKESKLKYYLSFLEGKEKEIVIYHIVLNMGFKDISKIMNIPQSTAFFLYKKAIKKIKEGL